MNGRVYDPLIGRFMSADPHITYPENLQSYNRYSYVLNNPLTLTDPSGFDAWGFEPWGKEAQRDEGLFNIFKGFLGSNPGANWNDFLNFYKGKNENSAGTDPTQTSTPGNPSSSGNSPTGTVVSSAPQDGGTQVGNPMGDHEPMTTGTSVDQGNGTRPQCTADTVCIVAKREPGPVEKWWDEGIERLKKPTWDDVTNSLNALPVGGFAVGTGRLASLSSKVPGSLKAIGGTGKVGEDALKKLVGGKGQKFFPTTMGARYVDQFVDGAAHEAKTGYTTLTDRISTQIAKDSELLATNQVNSVTWHFFQSPVTGAIGPSQPLYDKLVQSGFQVIIHKP